MEVADEVERRIVDLNPMNHAPALLLAAEATTEMQRYRIRLLDRYSKLYDEFSGKSLDIKTPAASLQYIDAGSKRLMSLQQRRYVLHAEGARHIRI